jgi:hypothetical protein
VNGGDFSVKHSFAKYGTNQVILRADTNSSITPAAFDVIVPSYPINHHLHLHFLQIQINQS